VGADSSSAGSSMILIPDDRTQPIHMIEERNTPHVIEVKKNGEWVRWSKVFTSWQTSYAAGLQIMWAAQDGLPHWAAIEAVRIVTR
jgi:hypothetical protein